MRPTVLFLAVIGAAFLAVSGCDKKSTTPGDDKPPVPSATVSIPAANFSDTCNAKAYTYAYTVKGLTSMLSAYAVGGVYTNGAWTWAGTNDGVSVVLTATKQGDGSYNWALVLNGTDTSSGTVYTNWTAMSGHASADGKSGVFTIYSENPTPSTNPEIVLTWSTDAAGMMTLDFEYPQENMKFVLLSNGTTGEVTEYVKVGSSWVGTGFHATWTAPGALATCG